MPTITLNAAGTTFVASAQPNTNFATYPTIYTGTDPSFDFTISYLKFDLSSVPVTRVDSAILELTVLAKTGALPSLVVVNRVTAPI
ncbi:MAG TPA: DNRLRE domain-containing protein [Clostridiales bacterium]|nr:DNRLRE domain-containing protein [Clostridiales bacterium]